MQTQIRAGLLRGTSRRGGVMRGWDGDNSGARVGRR
jgi:hypothetical protein